MQCTHRNTVPAPFLLLSRYPCDYPLHSLPLDLIPAPLDRGQAVFWVVILARETAELRRRDIVPIYKILHYHKMAILPPHAKFIAMPLSFLPHAPSPPLSPSMPLVTLHPIPFPSLSGRPSPIPPPRSSPHPPTFSIIVSPSSCCTQCPATGLNCCLVCRSCCCCCCRYCHLLCPPVCLARRTPGLCEPGTGRPAQPPAI